MTNSHSPSSADIVAELRELHAEMHVSIGSIAERAADEIERLQRHKRLQMEDIMTLGQEVGRLTGAAQTVGMTRDFIHLAAKEGNLKYWRDSQRQHEAYRMWSAGNFEGECPQLVSGTIVDYITDAVHAAQPPAAPVETPEIEEDDPEVLIAAKAIAEHGFGRPWDDFHACDASHTDQGDLLEYGRAAVAALRTHRRSSAERDREGELDFSIPTTNRIMGAVRLHTHDHTMAYNITRDVLAVLNEPQPPRETGEVHPVLKHADELHELGFNDGWNGAVDECAKFVEQRQENIKETSSGSERYLAPRKVGNQMGLAYVNGLRSLAVSRPVLGGDK